MRPSYLPVDNSGPDVSLAAVGVDLRFDRIFFLFLLLILTLFTIYNDVVGRIFGRLDGSPRATHAEDLFSRTIKSVARYQSQVKFGNPHVAMRCSVVLAGVEAAHRPLFRGGKLEELGLPMAVIDSGANPLSKERRRLELCQTRLSKKILCLLTLWSR